jgi:hypothetical protein
MRALLGLLAIVLLGMSFTACGGSSGSGSFPHAAASTAAPKKDRDDDDDNNDDDNQVLYYAQAAVGNNRQAIESLIVDYYAASAAENGAKACTLLMPFVAESVVESVGESPGLHGKNCAVVMSKLFKLHHGELATKSAQLKFYSVRASNRKALILLSYAYLPEVRQFILRRDGSGAWRVMSLLDGILE